MPSRNTLRADVEHTFYHVYARGASKQPLFLAPSDYEYFMRLFKRYLSVEPKFSNTGIAYPHCRNHVRLLAYCLMSNHFHLLVYQVDAGAMTALMRGIMTSYSRYFNLKYKRTGSLFESRYKASRIDRSNYLEHISRYIHLNPRYWRRYAYSSLRYYVHDKPPEWLEPELILEIFSTPQAYLRFVEDYESQKALLDDLKRSLADQ